jgi:hypothetical protein
MQLGRLRAKVPVPLAHEPLGDSVPHDAGSHERCARAGRSENHRPGRTDGEESERGAALGAREAQGPACGAIDHHPGRQILDRDRTTPDFDTAAHEANREGKDQNVEVWDDLLHGGETSVWADKGCVSASREAAFSGPGKFWGVTRKAPKGGALHPVDEEINRIIAMVRARVEHPFRVLKRQFGYLKTRYRGLAKNRAQIFTLFALGNLFLVRRKLLA